MAWDVREANVSPRGLTEMTDEQVWAIINAPDAVNASQLAEQLGLTRSAVRWRRLQLRRHEWSCKIDWTPCLVCGQPLIRQLRGHTRRYHPRCRKVALKHMNVVYGQARQERMTEEERLATKERSDAHYKRTMETTRRHATNSGRPYSEEEEDLIVQLSEKMTLEQVALEVGRTRAAVKAQLGRIRAREQGES